MPRSIKFRCLSGFTVLFSFLWWLFCLPTPLFKAPLATELLSTEGDLLSARIASDGQWRMPAADSVSPRLIAAVVNYEDRTFYRHIGVSGRGIGRALRDNWRAGQIVSGGSTLTMQVARMARGNQARTLVQKLLEAVWATRLEVRYSKAEILRFWLANAPFGGNVVGAEAAVRRYYARPPTELSWAEAATLAVLPNSPALLHPGRGRDELRAKRDRLLEDLVIAGHLTAEQAELAKLEPLPDKPQPLPRQAEHLLERLRQEQGPGRYRSSLPADLQAGVTELVNQHQALLAGNQIRNAAAMVTEVATGRVVAYVGNTNSPTVLRSGVEVTATAPTTANAGSDVDIITALRSPGSLLKPILYALAMNDGTLLPRQLLADVPTSFQDFQPANFYQDYDGAVPADEALARSLNIPFVYLLQDYGVPRLHAALRNYGFDQLTQAPAHYGLSLILGGGEITMEEINAWFTGLARQQRYFYERQGQYQAADFHRPTLLDDQYRPATTDLSRTPGAINAGAGWLMLQALRELNRPDETGATRRFTSHRPIAWKTGTSFGFRDAWAVGCTPDYVVSVWAGNADGEGRDGLVGVQAAAPLLFQVFRLLEDRRGAVTHWFEQPFDEMQEATTCQASGLLAGPDCPTTQEWIAKEAQRAEICTLHPRIFTDPGANFQVRQNCGPGPLTAQGWFTLPARQAYYYQRRNTDYHRPPPFHPNCATNTDGNPMQFIYPYTNGSVSAIKNWTGEHEAVFFELAHQDRDATVHWHLDGDYLASTTTFHTLAVKLTKGNHEITVVDQRGNRLERRVSVK